MKEITTKEKLERANNFKLLFRNGDCGKCRLQFLKQQAKELLEVKIKGCGELYQNTYCGAETYFPICCQRTFIYFCPKCQEENNQANKILKEINNG